MNFTDFNNTSYVESIEYNGYEKLHENNTSFLLKNNISNKILTNSSLKTTSNLTNVLSYHDPSYRIIGTIIMTIIFLIGVVGNIMVVSGILCFDCSVVSKHVVLDHLKPTTFTCFTTANINMQLMANIFWPVYVMEVIFKQFN